MEINNSWSLLHLADAETILYLETSLAYPGFLQSVSSSLLRCSVNKQVFLVKSENALQSSSQAFNATLNTKTWASLVKNQGTP